MTPSHIDHSQQFFYKKEKHTKSNLYGDPWLFSNNLKDLYYDYTNLAVVTQPTRYQKLSKKPSQAGCQGSRTIYLPTENIQSRDEELMKLGADES